MRAYRLAYDGGSYRGFQRQPHGETVEDALLGALRKLGVLDGGEDTPPGYAAAGRTDAGVSALAQTVAFEAPGWLTPRALNGELPADVRAWASADVTDGFHATHDARSRTYTYDLHAPAADERLAREVCARLSGEHDFHNLTSDADGTVRHLRASATREGAFLTCHFRAGGFPRGFVRRAVRLVESVATGDRSTEFVDRVLSTEPLDGPDGVAAAAPEPLVLLSVTYPAVRFAVDERAAASAREVFGARRTAASARARTMGLLSDGMDG
ncbi:MAG: tRNA pseudouridine(38-40) synthase TruA [Haloarculaceae archaeon]